MSTEKNDAALGAEYLHYERLLRLHVEHYERWYHELSAAEEKFVISPLLRLCEIAALDALRCEAAGIKAPPWQETWARERLVAPGMVEELKLKHRFGGTS